MKWSFIIITRGNKNGNIEKFINSVKQQFIPEYEIIIVGGKNRIDYGSRIRHIPFSQLDEKGWITKKKNIGCESAIYENLFVGHDDIMLHKDWYKDMLEYGDDWKVLNFIYINKNGERCYWEEAVHRGHSYISGSFIAMKNYIFDDYKWNEKLFWNQEEDVELSKRLLNAKIGWKISPAKVQMIDENLRVLR